MGRGGEVLGMFVRLLWTNQPGIAVMKKNGVALIILHVVIWQLNYFEEKSTPKVPVSQKQGNEERRLKIIVVGNIFQLLHE